LVERCDAHDGLPEMAVLPGDLVYEARMRHTFGLPLAVAALLGCAESTTDAATLANYTPTRVTTHPSGTRTIAAEPNAPEPTTPGNCRLSTRLMQPTTTQNF